jgi:hypothetical protein
MRERIVRIVAGAMILLSVTMSQHHSINWLWLTAFVGFNLLQSSITRFCPLEWGLKKFGVASGDGKSC